jgi:hypothetical protein
MADLGRPRTIFDITVPCVVFVISSRYSTRAYSYTNLLTMSVPVDMGAAQLCSVQIGVKQLIEYLTKP